MTRVIVAAAMGGLVAVLAACGDDDEDPEVTVSADPEATEAAPEPEPEETPDDGEEEAVPEPAPAPVTDVITEPSDKPLPEKMDRRLRNWLRQRHHVRSRISAVRSLPREEGGRRVLAVLTYSTYEGCMAEHRDDPRRGRERCREKMSSGEYGDPESMTHRLLLASFGATPSERPVGWGGSLEVGADVLLDDSCAGSIETLKEEDLDADGKGEVLVVYECDEGYVEERGEVWTEIAVGKMAVVAPDGRLLFARDLYSLESASAMTPMGNRGRRVRFQDENGDGSPDLIVETVEWEDSTFCEVDEDGFLSPKPGESDPDEYCSPAVDREVLLYDRATDEWEPAEGG